LMLGFRVGSARDIALMVTMPETEVETHIETLFETGLLIRRDEGVISLPTMPEVSRRAASARENGGIGGRPRRGETADQARERRLRQRELPLMSSLEGGVGKTHETQPETRAENPPRVRAATASSFASEESKQAAGGFGELGEEIAEMAGLDPARGTYSFGPVKEWLTAGATAELIREVVERIASRASYRAPTSLGYFTKAVREELALRGSSGRQQPPPDPERQAICAEYNRGMERYIANGCLGIAPTAPSFLRGAA
jgi:hypothetical protein